MSTIIFDGIKYASELEVKLQHELDSWLKSGRQKPKIVSIVFAEDRGSQIYTNAKIEVASRVGVDFVPIWVSFGSESDIVFKSIQNANFDQTVTGVMIQKPVRQTWIDYTLAQGASAKIQDFSAWWMGLTTQIAQSKDVDGLHPATQQAIAVGTWIKQARVLPATVTAILEIFKLANVTGLAKIAVIGKSDLVGQPLFHVLRQDGYEVTSFGSDELDRQIKSGRNLFDFDVIVSATGKQRLIKADMVKDGVIAIDVGEPVGDFDFVAVKKKARFITPVPGGVGPVTVVSLLANALACVRIQHSS